MTQFSVTPDLIRGPAAFDLPRKNRLLPATSPTNPAAMTTGGWVYIMADRYRGTIYVGVTANLPARIHAHRDGHGSDFCVRYGLDRLVWADHAPDMLDCIAHEKRLKRWRRSWKIALIEQANPDWGDLYDDLI